MTARQKAGFALALDRAAQEELAAGIRFEATDLERMDAALLASAIDSLDARTRNEAFGRFEGAEALERMTARQKAGFALALDRAAQEELAAGIRFEAADLERMDAALLASAIGNLDARARNEAFGRFVATEDAFGRWTSLQKAAFADALGARACGRAVLQARSFNRLSQAQQLEVWSNLGRAGQEAALRYAGLEADLARGTAMQRDVQFEKFMQERRADHGAATR